jgi:predicted nucleotidyltransferase
MMALPFDTNALIEICRQNDVAMLGVFGSMARGEATHDSDVDLLVNSPSARACSTSWHWRGKSQLHWAEK